MGAAVCKSNTLKGIMNHSTDGIHTDGLISWCQCPNEYRRVGGLWPFELNIIRQYARIVDSWVTEIGLNPSEYGTLIL